MFENLFRSKKTPKPLELTPVDKEWKTAFETLLREMVPGEVFELTAVKENGATRFELVTESRRAMVAWSEIQEVLQPVVPADPQETL